MFKIERIGEKKIGLVVDLPQGKTQAELVSSAKKEIQNIHENIFSFYGENVFISGRITTGMALMLGHFLAHITKSVSIFDPKENDYILCIQH